LHLSLVALETTDTFETWSTMGIRNNWEFAELFNFHIIKLFERGVMDKIKRKWIKSPTKQYGIARDGFHQFLLENIPDKIFLDV
jgi:hypothetical protein